MRNLFSFTIELSLNEFDCKPEGIDGCRHVLHQSESDKLQWTIDFVSSATAPEDNDESSNDVDESRQTILPILF